MGCGEGLDNNTLVDTKKKAGIEPMVRMSDILKKVKERKEKAEKKEIAEPSKKKRGLEQPPPQPVPSQKDKLEESSTLLKEELKTEKKTDQPESFGTP